MPKSDKLIVVTGAAGFIGSCLIGHLNRAGRTNILAVDDFRRIDKIRNLGDKKVHGLHHRDEFLHWIKRNGDLVEVMYHMGARTDTTEQDQTVFDRLNVSYSQSIWKACCRFEIPLVYASSAATYGLGEHGYQDTHDVVALLQPLNPYGVSKNAFDQWALQQESRPPSWYGLKFFNVFGPNEYHKGRMASVVFHTYKQVVATGSMSLFRSHRPDVLDGEQSRDFIYIKDLLKVMDHLSSSTDASSGLYNCGTGEARTFYDLAAAVFSALQLEPKITFIDTPIDIRSTYQYFTQADLGKLHQTGYDTAFLSLEEAVDDYVSGYLQREAYL